MDPKDICISDFTYHLPEEKIAAFPLAERDASKILLYKNGNVSEDIYKNLASHIPAGSLVVFNDTRVIQARILFQKPSGGVIEIFCLEPCETVNEYNVVMNMKQKVRWKCMIGGASKWKGGNLNKKVNTDNGQVEMNAVLVDRLPEAYIVELSWDPVDYSFAEMLELFGDMPLPPYIKRKVETGDKERYQTVYAKEKGSVAAPTAGLHFTERIFSDLAKKNISKTYVTLHVGAGTFKPVKASTLKDHEMHSEWIDVHIDSIKTLLSNVQNLVIAVGTTSLRVIETLYWIGVKIRLNPAITLSDVSIRQWDVYEKPLCETKFTAAEALESLMTWMKKNGVDRILTATQILIAPGYEFKIVKGLVTNFHQPQSTLLLLVAALIGDDWKKMYKYALENAFRFLSYGDGNLLLPELK
jgi:S-adenosylmethionine:tRNA ribosyltransferase-isomerase